MSTAIASWTSAARRIPWGLVARVGLLLTVLVFVLQLPFFVAGRAEQVTQELAQMLYVFLWMLLATSWTRTVPLSMLVSFWFVGLYPVVALSVMVGQPVAAALGLDSPMVYAFWVPLTEEALKALPILLFFAFAARRGTWQHAASDGLLLGCAVGSGFAFHEDAMFRRIGGDGWSAAAPWSYFFPTLGQGVEPVLSHTGWTALVGLAIGFAFLYRRRRWVWLLPLGAYVIVALDHMISNYTSGSAGTSGLTAMLYALDLNGLLPVLALLGGLLAALVLEHRALRQAASRDRWFPPIRLAGFGATVGAPTTWPAIIRWQGFLDYVRYRRALYYAVWQRLAHMPASEATDDMVRTVFLRGREAGLARAT
ncbi:MAG TPA: PrsW family glutamic-type intramembrane protease [Ktedonobacterales bacterium]|nr:PrsW family glutamic-type intramembrane protease [Ktedonobacterales bacterium]